MENNLTYKEAIEELESIMTEIENEDISVDELADKVKRASALIRLCKAKLTKTEDEVNKILTEMTADDTTAKSDGEVQDE